MNMPLSDSLMYRVACLSVTFSWHSWTHICASCWAHIPVLCEIHEWEKAGDSKNESENLQCYFHADPNAFGFRDIEVFIFISSTEVVLIVLVTLEWEEKITLLLGKDMGQSVKMWTEGPQPRVMGLRESCFSGCGVNGIGTFGEGTGGGIFDLKLGDPVLNPHDRLCFSLLLSYSQTLHSCLH